MDVRVLGQNERNDHDGNDQSDQSAGDGIKLEFDYPGHSCEWVLELVRTENEAMMRVLLGAAALAAAGLRLNARMT